MSDGEKTDNSDWVRNRVQLFVSSAVEHTESAIATAVDAGRFDLLPQLVHARAGLLEAAISLHSRIGASLNSRIGASHSKRELDDDG